MMLLLLATPILAQSYLKAGLSDKDLANSVLNNPKVGYGYCQDNQVTLLNLLIKDSQVQINKISIAIDEERRIYAKKAHLNLYRQSLYDTVMNQVMLIQIRDQLTKKGLYNLISASEKSKSLSVLQLDKITIDLERELLATFERSLSEKTAKQIGEFSVDFLKGQIYNELLQGVLKGAYKVAVTSELRNQIGQYLAGEISKQVVNKAVKTTLTAFSKNMFKSIARGIIIDMLTLPLQSFTRAPEANLVDMMEEVPELMINPEWINPAGSKVPARYEWKTHCLAMARKQKTIEWVLGKYRKSRNVEFAKELDILKDLRDFNNELKTPPRAERSTIQVRTPRSAVIK